MWELSQGLRRFLFLFAQVERDDWNFGTLGTCVSLKRFERSIAVEPFDKLTAG
jgi:hypothetical protein